MKVKNIFLGLALVAFAGATQGTFKFERVYKLNEKDTYKSKIDVVASMGEINVSMNIANTVKKVYDNGDADIETALSELKVSMGGQEMPAGSSAPPAMSQRYSKFGESIGEMTGGDEMTSQMNFFKYARLGVKEPMSVGQTIKISSKDEKKKEEVSGTVKFESLTNGIAALVTELDVKKDGTEKPMHIKMTSSIDAASSKLEKVVGTVTGVPAEGIDIDSLKFTMERNK